MNIKQTNLFKLTRYIYQFLKAVFGTKLDIYEFKEFVAYTKGFNTLGKENYAFYKRISGILNKERYLIIDVGANDGWFAKNIFRFCDNPHDLNIISFEPLVSCHKSLAALQTRYPNLVIEKAAVGDSHGLTKIKEIGTSGLSSIRSLNPTYNYDPSFFSEAIVAEYEVPIVTLSDYIKKVDYPIVLKVDTQGYEMEVLRGAEKHLKTGDVAFIIIELMTVEKYEGAKKYDEILKYLWGFGYKLFDLHPSYYEHDGQLSEFDAVFRGDSKIKLG
jgi:FkbM family methyltransferase